MHRWGRRLGGAVGMVVLIAGLLTACGSSTGSTGSSGAHVLLVGSFAGHAGQYKTIQAAVDAAAPGDWILVGPGDYHETADETGPPAYTESGGFGGVLITKPNLHLRGMDRNTAVVDGTNSGAPQPCSADSGQQNLGALGSDGKARGRNGIVVWKANNVSIDNLTTCNFLAGTGGSGNDVWWNGGADSGKIGLSGYSGSYLTTTSTYFGGETTASQYGVFASAAAGQGQWNQLYASNFSDSGMYVGACKQVCGVTIDNSWMEYNALGYSGTNSGGAIIIENSQFDNNLDGLDTNTQIGGDPPAPQNGACPNAGTSPITHTHSCWVFEHNIVHDNNNTSTPRTGYAGGGPVGTGMTVSGGRNDTVMDNTFANNGAWGVLFVPFPDSDQPILGQTCSGTGGTQEAGLGCVYDPEGDALLHNTFSHNGYFGNPSNSDFGQIVLTAGKPQNCFSGNTAPAGSAPANLEQSQPTCNGNLMPAANTGGPLLGQVLCDTGIGSCPAGANYPAVAAVTMHPLPANLPTMPNPCVNVPGNPWCASGRPI